MTWLGWDIGGANIKVATSAGAARSYEFPLWKQRAELGPKLAQIAAEFADVAHWAVTMTGELADCYFDKAEGVRDIVAAVESARAWHSLPNCTGAGCAGEAGLAERPAVQYFTVTGEFISASEALADAPRVAAANWRATAEWVAAEGWIRSGLVIDIGSTTTDIIPIVKGKPAPRGLTDTARLLCGELIYIGVARTPICALTAHLPLGAELCPVAAEFFATTADAYFLLGGASLDPTIATADGRPLDELNCVARLARCVGADSSTFTREDAQRAAELIHERHSDRIQSGIEQAGPPTPCEILVCGQGEFLSRSLATPSRQVRTLSELLPGHAGPPGANLLLSRCAPAYAVARLAANRLGGG